MIRTKSNFIVIFCILCFHDFSYGGWVCREASSTLSGRTLLSCGVGSDVDLQKAKDQARESAINEYERLCSISDECKQYQVEVEPKRTECVVVNSSNTCYRAIAFHLSKKKKINVFIDVKKVQREIEDRNKELQVLNTQLEALSRLEQKRKAIELLKNKIKTKEAKQIELSETISYQSVSEKEYKYTHMLFEHSIRVDLGHYGYDSDLGESFIGLGLSYEWRPTNSFGFIGGAAWGSSIKSGLVKTQSDVPSNGSANSTSSLDGESSYSEKFIGLTYYPNFYGVYIKGTVGLIDFKKKSYSVTYGPLGTKTGATELIEESQFSTYSAALGVDGRNDFKGWGWFAELGALGTSENSKIGPKISIGINFGF